MVAAPKKQFLPSTKDLPCSDDTPVDSEDQNLLPNLLLMLPGGEYDKKIEIYSKLGVLYCVIYNPDFWQRDQHQPFEVHKLVSGTYQLQIGEPYWMPEVGLGIGRAQKQFGGISQEMLTWYDENSKPHLSEAEQEKQKRERMEAFLKSQGFDPNDIPDM